LSNLRAGIVGIGVMGANHFRVLSNLEGVDLVGVADSAGLRGTLPKGTNSVSSVEELIKIGIDYCVVAAPTAFHEELALKLVDNGIHILVEKPLAHSYESAVRIRNAANGAMVIGAVGHIERYNSALQQARTRVQAGELGDIYQVATRRQGPFPARISDVGVVKDLATHDIDLTSWITGKEYVQVSAHSTFRSGREHEDLISISALLEDSIVVNHVVNWLSPLKERKAIITGEKGTYVVDTLRADLTFYENGKIDISQSEMARFRGVTQGDVHIFAFEKPEPLMVEHANFRDAVLGKSCDIVSLDQGVKTVRVADAVLESSKKLRAVII
jgi:UDP-N-acetylglucosamine 3-dehydrogenase